MTVNASEYQSYGPPEFYKPRFTVPSASLRDIQMATSLAGHSFLKNWLDQAEKLGDKEEWVNFLFLLSIATHFDPEWAGDAIFPLLPRAYQMFSAAGLADKPPVALYWPNILAPLFYHQPRQKGITDLAQVIFKSSDSVSRAGIVKLLCLSRDAGIASSAMEILQSALKDPNEVVRAEAILSLIKCGPIPTTATDALEACLDHPFTYLPAASALFHMTGNKEFFAIIQEAAEHRKNEVANQAAHALEPWPTRQCVIPSCRGPMQFNDYWMEWRKHVSPRDFTTAYQLWHSPAVKFFCCQCYNQVTEISPAGNSSDSE